MSHYFARLLAWVHTWGAWGPLYLILLYALVCLVFLPSPAMSLAAGFLFGPVRGAVTAVLGATLGATVAFLLGRFLLRGYLEAKLRTHPRFLAVDRALSRQGFKTVLLVRLCTLFPFDLANYLFGVTRVPLGRYLLATSLGRVPEAVVFAYLGSTVKNVGELASGKIQYGMVGSVFLALTGVAMIVAALVIARIARQALRELVDQPDAAAAAADKGV